MRISQAKTKLVAFGGPAAWSPIFVDGSLLEVVDAYKYLGSWYSGDCTLDKELSVRIGQATSAAIRLQNIWRSSSIGLATKVKFYKGLVLTILLHGAESWPLTGAQAAKLESFHHRWLRTILRVKWWQRIRNEEILQRAKIYSIGDRMRQVRMLWLGHVIRMGSNRLPSGVVWPTEREAPLRSFPSSYQRILK
jgi:hypothetical protein